MKKEDLIPLPYEYYSGSYEEHFNKTKWVGFKVDKLSVSGLYTIDQFQNEYRSILLNFQRRMFTDLMRIEWADRRILYDGINSGTFATGYNAIKFFYENYLGFSRKIWGDGFLKVIRRYADDFFPHFNEMDGFKDDFPYPFQYMNFECLCFVHNLEHRMALLAEGEAKHLSIPKFYDFVSAYTTDVHIKTGKVFNVFEIQMFDKCVPYINEVLSFAERLKRKAEKKKAKAEKDKLK